MSSKKIYENDCYKKTHTSIIEEIDIEKRTIILNETIFFPKGGGQECDLGMINGVRVLSVFEIDGIIYHEMEHLRYFRVGKEVYSELDFARRYDHMCQHTGEHILSGIVSKKYGFRSTGFHIGEDLVRVDYSGYLDEEMLEEVINEVNKAINDNHPIKIISGSKEEISDIAYRSKKEIDGEIRLVDCGVDVCACCAPHLKSTLEVASLICVSNEKYKRGSRLMILANKRAYEYVNKLTNRDVKIGALLDSPVSEIYSSIEGLSARFTDLQKKNLDLQNALIEKTEELYSSKKGNLLFYERLLAPKQAMNLIKKLGKDRDGYVLIFIGDKADMSFNLYYENNDASAMAKELLKDCEYKGGGKGENFQGKIEYNDDLAKIIEIK